MVLIRTRHGKIDTKRQIVLLLVLYGYFKYFTADVEFYYKEYSENGHINQVSNHQRRPLNQHLIDVNQGVTLPPHLQNNELFNLAKPTDSSGKEIFADKKIKTIIVGDKRANYSELMHYQIKTARECDVTKLWDDPGVKPDCTAALFRKYYDHCGYFLDEGRWKKWKTGYPNAVFMSTLCNLPKQNEIEKNIVKSVGKWKAKRILVLGDSNSHKLYLTLLETFFNYTNIDYKCNIVKKEPEGKNADAGYYTNGTKFKPEEIFIKERTCSSCNSEMSKCVLPKSSQYYGSLPDVIEFEYLSMTLVTLDGITIKRKGGTETQMITQQEFLIKYYLKDRYPDLLIIGATFTHDKRKPFDFVQKCLEHFIELVDEHVPKTTQVMWLDAAAHNSIPYNNCPILFNIRIFDMEYELKGNEKLEMLNHLMFYILKDKLISSHSKNLAMLDLYRLSNMVMKGWALDCVHFKPDWYKTMIGYMFGILATAE